MNRRKFIAQSAKLAATGLVADSLFRSTAFATNTNCKAAPKWNVLLISSDQHNPKIMGHGGKGSLVQTPHLDRLASQGMVFDKAYCNFPVCAPTRASLITASFRSGTARSATAWC